MRGIRARIVEFYWIYDACGANAEKNHEGVRRAGVARNIMFERTR